jgi:hypothetical protein
VRHPSTVLDKNNEEVVWWVAQDQGEHRSAERDQWVYGPQGLQTTDTDNRSHQDSECHLLAKSITSGSGRGTKIRARANPEVVTSEVYGAKGPTFNRNQRTLQIRSVDFTGRVGSKIDNTTRAVPTNKKEQHHDHSERPAQQEESRAGGGRVTTQLLNAKKIPPEPSTTSPATSPLEHRDVEMPAELPPFLREGGGEGKGAARTVATVTTPLTASLPSFLSPPGGGVRRYPSANPTQRSGLRLTQASTGGPKKGRITHK